MSVNEPRILLLLPNLANGGSERQAVLLALMLQKKGRPVAVATLQGGGYFAESLERAGVPQFLLGARGLASVLRSPFNLTRLLRRERIDVLYSFLPHANVVASLAGLLAPRCRVVWSVRSADMALAGYGLKTRLVYALERPLARLPDRIVANSTAGFEACIRKGFPRSRLQVVHNGFDTGLFRPDSGARQRLRAEFGVTDGEILIGLPARLDPIKDHPTFLRAAALLCSERPDVRFICLGGAGPKNYAAELRALAAGLGLSDRVVWAGNRDDMPASLNALDIATLCSRSEGFPNTVGESMACGVPCVVTDVGDAASLVGDTGYAVPVSDPAALTQAWRRLLDPALRARMGAAARQRIVEKFGLERLGEETLTALSDAR